MPRQHGYCVSPLLNRDNVYCERPSRHGRSSSSIASVRSAAGSFPAAFHLSTGTQLVLSPLSAWVALLLLLNGAGQPACTLLTGCSRHCALGWHRRNAVQLAKCHSVFPDAVLTACRALHTHLQPAFQGPGWQQHTVCRHQWPECPGHSGCCPAGCNGQAISWQQHTEHK